MSGSGGPGRTASFAELATLVDGLREEVAGLRADLVPRDELRTRRRRALATILVAALLAFGLENTALSGCFLAQPKPGSATRAVCGYVFPGYGPVMRQGDAQRAAFRDLLRKIPSLERRVAELEKGR